ncbi:MAG: YgiT-type zinc finger protein [Ignavibacteriae bacterium]|nr:YgiT-type zinc finger protein [Ignavibacteriota bacterium]
MKCDLCGGTIIEQLTSYSIETNGKMHLIEHVPARVCTQCGERFYSPATVRKIQEAILQERLPDKIIQMPVIDFVSI